MVLGTVVGWILYVVWICLIGVAALEQRSTSPTASTDSRRRLDPRDRVVRHHRLLAVQPGLLQREPQPERRIRLLRRARSARPRDRLGRHRRRRRRVPVVEHEPGAGLHGRHRARWRSAARSPPLAIVSHTELLLLLIGGVFVIETRLGDPAAGLLQAQRRQAHLPHEPIHHHFELKGWAEVTIVVRFWIIARPRRRSASAASTSNGCRVDRRMPRPRPPGPSRAGTPTGAGSASRCSDSASPASPSPTRSPSSAPTCSCAPRRRRRPRAHPRGHRGAPRRRPARRGARRARVGFAPEVLDRVARLPPRAPGARVGPEAGASPCGATSSSPGACATR